MSSALCLVCSYPTDAHQTIPNSLAVVYNWICFVVAVIVVELLLFRHQHSLTVGITGKQVRRECTTTH